MHNLSGANTSRAGTAQRHTQLDRVQRGDREQRIPRCGSATDEILRPRRRDAPIERRAKRKARDSLLERRERSDGRRSFGGQAACIAGATVSGLSKSPYAISTP